MPNTSKRPLKIGLVMPIANEWMAGKTARWKDMAAMAGLAEAAGFDSIWVNDHMFSKWGPDEPLRGNWEGWSLLSALAAVTSRVELGTFVICTAFRNPALLAKMADAVDDISDGRLILGIGAGYHEPEFRAFGYPFDHLVGRFEEAVTIVHTLLREGKIDFKGTFHEAPECELVPRLSRRNGPPILMGPRITSPRMLRLTAKFADYYALFNFNAVAAYGPVRDAVDVACRDFGRDPATLARMLCVAVDVPGMEDSVDRDSWVRPFRLSLAATRGAPLTGSVDQVADGLRAFAAAGLNHAPVWLDPLSMAGVERFARVLEALDRDG